MTLERAVPTAPVPVTVVICAYTVERWETLCKAINSLLVQSSPPHEIVVVIDNNAELLELTRTTFPNLIVTPNDEAPGNSGARNAGISRATGDIVAFIDDDAIAEIDWIRNLLIAYENPDVLGVGGLIIPDWPNDQPRWFPEEFYWVVGCTYRGMNEHPGPVRNLIGANMSFRRSVFGELRFYDGQGYANGKLITVDDTDICIRISQRWPGTTLMFQPGARVRHQVSQRRLCWSYFHERCFNEGLAKSILSHRIGATDGLASEWPYTLKTLPAGVLRGIRDAVFSADPGGFVRSAAIISGFSVTLAGYIVGTAAHQIPVIRRYAGIRPNPDPGVQV